jgi:hypothetical protein
MQWQLIPETTMHAFDINALLTMITINKLTDRTQNNSGNDRKQTQFFFLNVKTINVAVKTQKRRCLRRQQLIFVGLIHSFAIE